MSRELSPEIEFTDANDCNQLGCPGHKLQLSFCRSSDTTSVVLDGQVVHAFDDHEFQAVIAAYHAFLHKGSESQRNREQLARQLVMRLLDKPTPRFAEEWVHEIAALVSQEVAAARLRLEQRLAK